MTKAHCRFCHIPFAVEFIHDFSVILPFPPPPIMHHQADTAPHIYMLLLDLPPFSSSCVSPVRLSENYHRLMAGSNYTIVLYEKTKLALFYWSTVGKKGGVSWSSRVNVLTAFKKKKKKKRIVFYLEIIITPTRKYIYVNLWIYPTISGCDI